MEDLSHESTASFIGAAGSQSSEVPGYSSSLEAEVAGSEEFPLYGYLQEAMVNPAISSTIVHPNASLAFSSTIEHLASISSPVSAPHFPVQPAFIPSSTSSPDVFIPVQSRCQPPSVLIVLRGTERELLFLPTPGPQTHVTCPRT